VQLLIAVLRQPVAERSPQLAGGTQWLGKNTQLSGQLRQQLMIAHGQHVQRHDLAAGLTRLVAKHLEQHRLAAAG
jgi:hypothetical protein